MLGFRRALIPNTVLCVQVRFECLECSPRCGATDTLAFVLRESCLLSKEWNQNPARSACFLGLPPCSLTPTGCGNIENHRGSLLAQANDNCLSGANKENCSCHSTSMSHLCQTGNTFAIIKTCQTGNTFAIVAPLQSWHLCKH